jgi:hypothetical protein
MKRFTSLVTLLVLIVAACNPASAEPPKLDVPYVPTPEPVVQKMLEMAQVKEGDLVYDLGCGDGRIVVTAAKEHGARGVGVDIDPQRIAESKQNAEEAGVTDRVKFIQQDLFTMDFSDADVLTLYLLPSVNLKLRPAILNLRPGTRVVSHSFSMDDWEPDDQATVSSATIYYWVVPAKVEGTWNWEAQTAQGRQPVTMTLNQKFQEVSGSARVGEQEYQIRDAKLEGDQLSFVLAAPDGNGGAGTTLRYQGQVAADSIRGRMLEGMTERPQDGEARPAAGRDQQAQQDGQQGIEWTAQRKSR